ncbi:hypothetical protein P170DRAFT_470388 [Aspergillus steynii IBT 23096]|uniref:DUF3533 domain-containing protein n=1 Tax=Aspergillus steynii IBT 23096 TaxID=1392250 RepID=A0A2I2GQ08_9EURO|nr:uncharacterized protein P170DRAFT_470388 [Aspergillus steynii IBT 23096]PLB54960.1 hypothetical protein P170DRAFT_470388 [Aspergillus steynii IBT 23096]
MPFPKPFLIAATGAFVSLQLLFLANMSYLYGTAYHESLRISKMEILFVDFDQDVIGNSVTAAYQGLEGAGFPTLRQHPAAEYPTITSVRQAVCRGPYWGAITANSDASSRLSAALTSSDAAESYNNAEALTYVWNEAKYSAYAQTVYSSLEMLVQATRMAYNNINGTKMMSAIDTTDESISQILLDPISATEINIMPTTQGPRFYYNTVSMVMPILQQFFFIMALNGLSQQFNIFQKLSLRANVGFRLSVSLCYTLVASLCMSGYIWAFRENWEVSSNQFGLTWMAIWLAMHAYFLMIDAALVVIPVQFASFFILTWIILNVSSTISPFDLSPGFYRLGYALPAYELYQVLVDIWTDGCNPYLYRSLPILFSWWVVGLALFLGGMARRVKVSRFGPSASDSRVGTPDEAAEKIH